MDKEKENNLDLPEIDFGADDLGDFDLNHDFKDEGAEESLLPVVDDTQSDDLTFASTDGLPEIDWGDSPVSDDHYSDLTEIKNDAIISDHNEDHSITDEIIAEPSFDDDGPIALSEDELDNILDSGVLEDEMDSGLSAPAVPSPEKDEVLLEKEDDGWDLSVSPDEFDQYLDDLDVDAENDDRIELVDDGADSVSTDETAFASETPDDFTGDYLQDDSDDDGPIALTDEELGNIVSEISTADIDAAIDEPSTDAYASKGMESDSYQDDKEDDILSAPDFDDFAKDTGEELKLSDSWETEDTKESFFEDEDEGPVALSNDELNSILEDVSDTDDSEEYKNLPQSDTVMAAAVPDRTELIDEAAEESNLKKDELRKMISYLDGLFDQLPDDTIKEFSRSEYFDLYKKIMHELELDK